MSAPELWLNKEDVCTVTGWAPRTVAHHAEHDHLRSKRAEQAGRNGRRERLYAASSLPAQHQPKLLEFCLRRQAPEAGSGAAALPVLAHADDLGQAPLFAPAAPPPAELAGLNDEQRATASARFAVVESVIAWREGKRAPFKTLDGREVRTLDQFVHYRAAELQTAPRTIYNWLARYDNGGATPQAKFKALADRARKDRGICRVLRQYPKAAEYALIKFLGLAPSAYLSAARELRLPGETQLDYRMPRYRSERLPVTAVYAGIERCWADWYPDGSRPPSYTTIRNFLQSIPECVVVMAREGQEAYEQRCEPHGKRRWDDMPVMGQLVSDHRILDVFGYNDDYFPAYLQEPYSWMRVWLTTLEDQRTRRIVGWCFSVNPSSRSVAAALRMTAQRFGMPRSIYMDNGEDYKLFAKILKENFGIERSHAKPYRPRSKAIESWHSTMSKRFDPLFGPAYAGHDAKDRSEENSIALRQHKLWRDGKCASTPLPPVSHIVRMFETWVEQEYNEWAHNGQDMQGLSPRVLFERDFRGAAVPDIAQLEPLFWQRETRVVNNSKVQIFKQFYEAADPESEFNLRMYANGERREIRIACNPDDLAVALAYDIEGPDHRFIARLQAQQLLSQGPVSRDAIAAMERQNAQFRNGLRQFSRTLARRAEVAGIGSELDALAHRAAVNGPVPMLPPAAVSSSRTEAVLLASPAVPSAAEAARRFLSEEE